MKNLSDEILWKSLKDGDLKAFEVLFKSYYSALYSYGLKISKDPILTEDSLQDFFIYIYEHRQNLSDLNSIAPYLFASYRRLIIKKLQKNQKRRFVRDIDEKMVDIQFTAEETLIHQESESFRDKNLAVLLNKLPKRQREVIFLKFHCNLKTTEIADTMEINYQSVVNTLHKALKSLRYNIKISQLFNS